MKSAVSNAKKDIEMDSCPPEAIYIKKEKKK